MVGKQSRQLIHTGKIEMQEKLGMLILQSIDDSVLLVASLMMNLKLNLVPYVPTKEVGVWWYCYE